MKRFIHDMYILKQIIVGLLSFILLCGLCSCNSDQKLGDYVYIDKDYILHMNRQCEGVARVHGAQPVFSVEVKHLAERRWEAECSRCVDDNRMEALYVMISLRAQKVEKRKLLYHQLRNLGYNDIGTFSDFNTYMDNPSNRRKLYDRLRDSGLEMGDAYDEEGITSLDSIYYDEYAIDSII